MYTATIQSKTVEANGVVSVNVVFSDGKNNIPETVRPSDMDGFNYWVKSRLTALNSVPDIITNLPDGKVIDHTAFIPQPEVIDPEQAAKIAYWDARNKLIQVKTDIELGLATQADYDAVLTEATALKSETLVDTVAVITK